MNKETHGLDSALSSFTQPLLDCDRLARSQSPLSALNEYCELNVTYRQTFHRENRPDSHEVKRILRRIASGDARIQKEIDCLKERVLQLELYQFCTRGGGG